MKLILSIVLSVASLVAQVPTSDYAHFGNFDLSRARMTKPMRVVQSAPSGVCLIPFEQIYSHLTGSVWVCKPSSFVDFDGIWTQVAGGGGSGGGYTTIRPGTGANLPSRDRIRVEGAAGGIITPTDAPGTNETILAFGVDPLTHPTWGTTATGEWCSTGGSGTAYTCGLTPALSSRAVPGNGYASGMRMTIKAHTGSGSTPTLNIDAVGAKRIYAADGASDPALTSGQVAIVVYDAALNGAAGGWRLAASAGSSGGAPVPTRGTYSARPACTQAGQVYHYTNSPYPYAHCDGSTWLNRLPNGGPLVGDVPALSSTGVTGGTTVTTTNGGAYMYYAQPGDAVLSAASSGNTFTHRWHVRHNWNRYAADTHISLIVSDGTNKMGLLYGWNGSVGGVPNTFRQIRCESGSYTSQYVDPLTILSASRGDLYVEVVLDGTNATWRYSEGGVFWLPMGPPVARSACSLGTVTTLSVLAFSPNTGGVGAVTEYASIFIGGWGTF